MKLIKWLLSWFKKPSIQPTEKVVLDVQINGFDWDKIAYNPDTSKEEIEKLGKEKIADALWKTQIIKVVLVPGKFINFVTKLPVRKSAEKVKLKCNQCKKDFYDYISCHSGAILDVNSDNGIRGRVLCNECENGSSILARSVPVTESKKEMIYIDVLEIKG